MLIVICLMMITVIVNGWYMVSCSCLMGSSLSSKPRQFGLLKFGHNHPVLLESLGQWKCYPGAIPRFTTWQDLWSPPRSPRSSSMWWCSWINTSTSIVNGSHHSSHQTTHDSWASHPALCNGGNPIKIREISSMMSHYDESSLQSWITIPGGY